MAVEANSPPHPSGGSGRGPPSQLSCRGCPAQACDGSPPGLPRVSVGAVGRDKSGHSLPWTAAPGPPLAPASHLSQLPNTGRILTSTYEHTHPRVPSSTQRALAGQPLVRSHSCCLGSPPLSRQVPSHRWFSERPQPLLSAIASGGPAACWSTSPATLGHPLAPTHLSWAVPGLPPTHPPGAKLLVASTVAGAPRDVSWGLGPGASGSAGDRGWAGGPVCADSRRCALATGCGGALGPLRLFLQRERTACLSGALLSTPRGTQV